MPAARRLTVGRLMEGHGLSQRRACSLVGIGHSTLSYQRCRVNDEAVRKRLRELAAQRRRLGYRRLAAGAREPRRESQESLPASTARNGRWYAGAADASEPWVRAPR
jgi:putative transposase